MKYYILLLALLILSSCAQVDSYSDENNITHTSETHEHSSRELHTEALTYDESKPGECKAWLHAPASNKDKDPVTNSLTSNKEAVEIKKVFYYIERSSFQTMQDNHKHLSYVSDTLRIAAAQAAEFWMSETHAPPFVYGGSITQKKFLNLSDKDNTNIYILIQYNPDCFNEDNLSISNNKDNNSLKNINCNTEGVYANTSPYLLDPKNDIHKHNLLIINLYGKTLAKSELLESERKQTNLTKEGGPYKLSAVIEIPWRTTVDEHDFIEVPLTFENKESPQHFIRYLPTVTIRGVLLHEFGHALGLDHADSEKLQSCASPWNKDKPPLYHPARVNYSVMAVTPRTRDTTHAWQWEKVCLNRILQEREVTLYEGRIKPKGSLTDVKKIDSVPSTTKASRFGINTTNLSNQEEVLLLCTQPTKDIVTQNTPHSEQVSYTPDIKELYLANRLCSKEKENHECIAKTTKEYLSQEATRINQINANFYVSPTVSKVTNDQLIVQSFIYNDSGRITVTNQTVKRQAFDPPLLKMKYRLATINSYVDEEEFLKTTKVKADGTTTEEILSLHIPVSIAYDSNSNNFIYAIVDTERHNCSYINKEDWPDHEGGIQLAVVKGNAKKPYLLSTPEYLHKPSSGRKHIIRDSLPNYRYWSPRYKTQFGVAIACSDKHPTTYNCFLAWADRGMPRYENVFYTWFRVNQASNKIEWSHRVYVRNKFYAASHLSAAFVNDAVVLTTKGKNNTAHLTINRLNSHTNFHSNIDSVGSGIIVDPPSISALPYRFLGTNASKELKKNKLADGYIMWSQAE